MDIVKIINNWNISYDPYSDKFQMYDSNVFLIKDDDLSMKNNENIKMLYKKNNDTPMLIEIDNVYDKFNIDFSEISKAQIIQLIVPYIKTL